MGPSTRHIRGRKGKSVMMLSIASALEIEKRLVLPATAAATTSDRFCAAPRLGGCRRRQPLFQQPDAAVDGFRTQELLTAGTVGLLRRIPMIQAAPLIRAGRLFRPGRSLNRPLAQRKPSQDRPLPVEA
jgi:hypothetical protein